MGVVVGSVSIPGSTGNFSVTGLPFQPVAVVFFNQYEPFGPHSFTLGAATGSSEQWGIWTGTTTELSGYNARKRQGRTNACAFQVNSVANTEQWRVSLVSLNAAGFTLNLAVRNSVGTGDGAALYYMAIGGSHISDAHAGTFSAGASTGTTAITAPGFKPTCAIFSHVWDAAFDSGVFGSMAMGAGLTDGTTSYSWAAASYQGGAVTVDSLHKPGAVACLYSHFAPVSMVIEHDSWDTNGFTVDCTTALGSNITHTYLAIKADGAVAGTGVQPNANTTDSHATPGLEPEGVYFIWPGVDVPSTTGASVAPLRPGVGAGTISQQRLSAGISRSTAPFGTWTSDGYQINSEPLGFWGVGDGVAGGSNLSQASAAISAMTMGSFDLTWTSVLDTNDRAYGWLALPGELGGWLPQIYRRQT